MSSAKYEHLDVAAAQSDSAVYGGDANQETVAVEVIEPGVAMMPPMYSPTARSSNQTATTTVTSPMMLEVVAPATLGEGYELEVNVGGDILTVIVPPGGVEQGQTFMAAVAMSSVTKNRHSVPVGAWRDGLFDCCIYGFCHPLVWTAFCCIPVVLAQVLYRMKLDWCGFPTSRDKAEETFFVVIGIFVGFVVVRQFVIPYLSNGSLTGGVGVLGLTFFIDVAFVAYLVIVMTRARRYIRNKYAIPAGCCGDCDDCCCSFWCKACTVAHMARHTADYDTYAARCCTKTGLPPHVPEIV